MSCQRCQSERVLSVGGKVSDMFWASIGDKDHDGYVPDDLGCGSGDYFTLSYCLDCGQTVGEYPLPKSKLETNDEET